MIGQFEIDGAQYNVGFEIPENAEKSAQYVLATLLLGNLSLSSGGKFRGQTTNFAKFPAGPQKKKNLQAFEKILNEYGVGCTPAEFVTRTLPDNRRFYQELLAEFTQYFLQTRRGSHTAAFVFLYRIMERLFYSIPLLYVSTTKDYSGTFNDLKSLFNDDKSGEHGFFKKFMAQGRFIDSTILDQIYTIKWIDGDPVERRYRASLRKVTSSLIPAGPTLNYLGCKFGEMSDVLVGVRNRFFHTRTGDGQKNISLKELGDPDRFFETLNPLFCSYLAVVAMHSIAKKYRTLVN